MPDYALTASAGHCDDKHFPFFIYICAYVDTRIVAYLYTTHLITEYQSPFPLKCTRKLFLHETEFSMIISKQHQYPQKKKQNESQIYHLAKHQNILEIPSN